MGTVTYFFQRYVIYPALERLIMDLGVMLLGTEEWAIRLSYTNSQAIRGR